MVFKLVITPRANNDVINAVDYYDAINPVLSARFLKELSGIYIRLENNPQFYSLLSSNLTDKFRDIKMPSFPYLVVFEIHKDIVIINAVLNTHKKPFLH